MAISLFVLLVLSTLVFIFRVNRRPGRRLVFADVFILAGLVALVVAIVAVVRMGT